MGMKDRAFVVVAIVLLWVVLVALSVVVRNLENTFEHSVAETSWRISSLEAQVERLLEEAE